MPLCGYDGFGRRSTVTDARNGATTFTFNDGDQIVTTTTTLLADAAQVNTFQSPASAENPMLEEFYYVSTNRNEATAHFRHAQKASVVFGDGHVAMEKMESGSLDQNLPGQFVGRLRADALWIR